MYRWVLWYVVYGAFRWMSCLGWAVCEHDGVWRGPRGSLIQPVYLEVGRAFVYYGVEAMGVG